MFLEPHHKNKDRKSFLPHLFGSKQTNTNTNTAKTSKRFHKKIQAKAIFVDGFSQQNNGDVSSLVRQTTTPEEFHINEDFFFENQYIIDPQSYPTKDKENIQTIQNSNDSDQLQSNKEIYSEKSNKTRKGSLVDPKQSDSNNFIDEERDTFNLKDLNELSTTEFNNNADYDSQQQQQQQTINEGQKRPSFRKSKSFQEIKELLANKNDNSETQIKTETTTAATINNSLSKFHRTISLGPELERIKLKFGGKNEIEKERQEKVNEYDNLISEIKPNLFLGSVKIAKNKEMLESKNVTHILNSARNVCENFHENDEKFKYLSFYLLDGLQEDILCCFYDAYEFLLNGTQNGNISFVHCWQGVSRSASLVIMYLMLSEGLNFQTALEFVKEKRPIVRPNAAFTAQIMKWEKIRKFGVSTPILYRIEKHYENDSLIIARTVFKFKKEDLISETCCVLHTPTNIFLWKGSNSSQEYISIAKKHVVRLQDYEKGGECIEINECDENPNPTNINTFYSFFSTF